MVNIAPNIKDSITLFRLRCASTPPSRVISNLVPGWSFSNSVLMSFTNLRTSLATLTVLASRERVTKMPTLGLPLRMLKPAMSAKLSLMVATSARRTICPATRLTTMP